MVARSRKRSPRDAAEKSYPRNTDRKPLAPDEWASVNAHARRVPRDRKTANSEKVQPPW